MAVGLRSSILDFPFVGGLDTKTSSKLLAPPGLLELRNGRYLKTGQIDKRYGYENLGLNLDSGTLNTPSALTTYQNELLMLSADRLYSYSEADRTWYDKSRIARGSTQLKAITASPVSSSGVDVITQGDVEVATWLEGTTYYYSIFDQSTGNAVVSKATLMTSAGSTYPRLAAAGTNAYIFWNDSTDLKYIRVPVNAPTSTTTGTLYSDMDSSGAFDVAGLGEKLYIFYKLTGVTTARIAKADVNLNIEANNTFSEDPQNPKSTVIQAFNSTSAGKDLIFLGWVDSSNNLKSRAYDVTLVSQYSTQTIQASADADDNVIIAINDTTGSEVAYVYTFSAGATRDYYIQSRTIDTSGTMGSAPSNPLLRSVGIVSRPVYIDGVSYFTVLHDSTLQATYFTVDLNGKIVAKFAPTEAGTHSATRRASNFTSRGNDEYIWGALKKGRIESENATLFSNLSPYTAIYSLEANKNYITNTVNKSSLISGGILTAYDGKSVTEYGFHLFPEDVTVTPQTSGGSIPDGAYLVQVIYEWQDAQGVIHRSAPSVAQTATVSGGGGSGSIDVVVPTLHLTDKSSDLSSNAREDIKIRVFVTTDSGTVPYFNAEGDNPNIFTTTSSTVTCTADPAGNTSNEIIYTSGGALDNLAAVPHDYNFTHDNRVWLVGLEQPNQIRFSKDLKPGTAAAFNDDLLINLDPQGGDAVAGASMDNYAIIFKETATYAIAGSGPNDLGQGSNLGAPQLISSDIGCRDPKSILQTPEGIIWMSNKGIYRLTRGLDFQYLGDKVEDFTTSTVLSSDILKDSNEIRFVLASNQTLVYNYYFNQWSVFDTPGAIDASTWKTNDYVYLSSTKAMREDSTTYLDDGSYTSLKIRTGWIHFGGLQGFQRVKRMALLGTYYTNHAFTIKAYFNYSDIPKQDTTITASDIVNTSTWGDAATWGANDFWGGSDNDEVYQVRVGMKIQKCQSVSFEISDSIVGGNIGRGFSLEGLALEIGRKKGMTKLAAGRSK